MLLGGDGHDGALGIPPRSRTHARSGSPRGEDASRLRDALGWRHRRLRAAVLTRKPHGRADRLAQAKPRESAQARIAGEALGHFEGDAGALVALAMNTSNWRQARRSTRPRGRSTAIYAAMAWRSWPTPTTWCARDLPTNQSTQNLLRELAVLVPGTPVVPTETIIGAARRLSTDAAEFELVVVSDGAFDAEPGPRIVLAIDADARVRDRARRGDP